MENKEVVIQNMIQTLYLFVEVDKNLENYINEVYQRNLKNALKASQESEFYKHHIHNNGTIEKNIISNRLIGLYGVLGDEFFISLLEKINFKFYKEIKKLDSMNLDKSDHSKYITNLFKKTYVFSNKLDIYNDFTTFIMSSLIYLSLLEKINLNNYEKTLQVLNGLLCLKRFKFKDLKKSKGKEIISRWGLENLNSFDDLDFAISNIEKKIFSIVSFTLDEFDFFVGNLKIEKQEFENIAGLYFEIFKNKNKKDSLITVYYLSIIYMLAKENKKIKELYFENHKDNMIFEIENLKKENKNILNLNNNLKFNISKLESKRDYLDSENKRIQKELNRFLNKDEKEKTKNKELKIKIKELQEVIKKFKKENQALEEALKASNQSKVEINYIDKLKVYLYENNLKIAILGGQPNWQKKIEEIFASSILEIYREDAKYDYIFVKTDSISHAEVFGKEIKYINFSNLQEVAKEILGGL